MMEQLTIRVLGGLDVQLGGQPLTEIGTRKADALLAYLVCEQRPYPREILADLLWDDRTQQQALANLRSLLSGLRRKLKPFLLITRQTIAFNPDSNFWLDKFEFEQLLNQAPRPSASKPATPIPQLQKALDLYRGSFLEGFYLRDSRGFEEWAILERERLEQLAMRGLLVLVDDAQAHGRYPQARRYNQRLLQMDPLNEHTQRQQMLLQLRSGEPNAALKQYEQCRRLLKEELDVEPAPATQALHERITQIQFPPPLKIPTALSPFVGRQTELEQISEQLLAADGRLLTLLGAGGMGKTRLAGEVGRFIGQRQLGRFLDGIFFISLTAVNSPFALPTYIAEEIGLAFQGSEPPQTQLLTYLREKEMLLILDNFEHLMAGGAAPDSISLIIRILEEATAVKLLITSRERLNLYGEALFEVAGLSLPENEADNAQDFEAVALFLQQAQRLDRRFKLTAENSAHVIQICRLLDGIPLAIELAAGWLRQHQSAEIVVEIEKSLDYLQTTYHNVPQRQRSLRAVFDHSWHLLAPDIQDSFASLAIFPDTFPGEAATAVAGVDTTTLHTLVDKSLLQVETSNGRYQIHPILRQYSLEKLADREERYTAVAQKHAQHFLALVREQTSGETPEERARLRQELPNIRAAWAWAVDQQEFAALEGNTAVLQAFFSIQSRFQDGIELFQMACQQAPKTATPAEAPVLCDLLGRTARMHIHIGQLNEASALLQKAMTYLEEMEDPALRSNFLSYSAISVYYAGDYKQAIERAKESLSLAEQINDWVGIAFAYNFLGSCAKAQGDFPQSQHYFELALKTYQNNDDVLGAAMALNNLGNLAQARAQYPEAQSYYEACIESFKAIDHVHGAATTLANAGRLALKLKEYDKARQMLTESLTIKSEHNDERGMAVALVGLGAISVTTNQFDEAKAELSQAIALAASSGDTKTILESMVSIAALLWKSGDVEGAGHLLTFVLNHKACIQEIREEAENLVNEANLPLAVTPNQTVDEMVQFATNRLQ